MTRTHILVRWKVHFYFLKRQSARVTVISLMNCIVSHSFHFHQSSVISHHSSLIHSSLITHHYRWPILFNFNFNCISHFIFMCFALRCCHPPHRTLSEDHLWLSFLISISIFERQWPNFTKNDMPCVWLMDVIMWWKCTRWEFLWKAPRQTVVVEREDIFDTDPVFMQCKNVRFCVF